MYYLGFEDEDEERLSECIQTLAAYGMPLPSDTTALTTCGTHHV